MSSDDLRVSDYPRALVHPTNTYFGLVKEWWSLMATTALLMFMLVILFGIVWWAIPPVILIEGVLGYLLSKWDVQHIKIYNQYSRQRDAYEPGFFIRQRFFKRPESMGRDYLG
jgi:hypothetical protein